MAKAAKRTPEFRTLSEAEVRAALRDENPANPVGCEVVRLAHAYADQLRAFVRAHGYVPDAQLYVPQSPIEAVALDMLACATQREPEGDRGTRH